MWTLVNFETMEMVNAEQMLVDNTVMTKFIPGENDLKFSKIPAITHADYEEEFQVRYNDIDVNMHANNSNYIIWALEPLPYEFKKEKRIKNIDMIFKKEIKYNEKLISQVQISDNGETIHILKNLNTNEDLCHVKCEWV